MSTVTSDSYYHLESIATNSMLSTQQYLLLQFTKENIKKNSNTNSPLMSSKASSFIYWILKSDKKFNK